jgi:hypothetical protein
MRILTIALITGIGLYYFYTLIKKDIEHPHKPVYLKLVEQDFHDDFDSTYYHYGCKTDTFKLNHKCNGK